MATKRLAIFSTLLLAGLALADVQLDSDLFPLVDLEDAYEEAAEGERDLRMIETPVTASRVADVVINNILDTLQRVGKTRRFVMPGTLKGNVPLDTESGPRAIGLELSNVRYLNVGSISRSKTAEFNTRMHRIIGSFMFERLGVIADYKLKIPAIGIAPASSASGRVRAVADTFFIDYTFMTDSKGLPLDIQRWRPRKGKFTYLGETGLDGNRYQPIFQSLLKDGAVSALNRLVSRQLFNIFKRDIMGQIEFEE